MGYARQNNVDKIKGHSQGLDKLGEHGVRVKVIGNVSYLPEDMQELIAKATKVTEDNTECTLNVAFSYTSREEIVHAVRQAATRVQAGHLMPNQVSEEVLERLLYTSHSSLPDLLIRTSGETRLSDFLLWQSSYSVTYFTQVLWPDFNLWYLMAGIFHYQRNSKLCLKLGKTFSRINKMNL